MAKHRHVYANKERTRFMSFWCDGESSWSIDPEFREIDYEKESADFLKHYKSSPQWLAYMASLTATALPVFEDEIDEPDEVLPSLSDAQLKNQRDRAFKKIRVMVYDRDKGTCQVCGDPVAFKREYECGHKIDREVGGSDDPDNLVVMCHMCNQTKPVTETLEEYETWAATGGRLKVIEDGVRDFLMLHPDAFKGRSVLDLSKFVSGNV